MITGRGIATINGVQFEFDGMEMHTTPRQSGRCSFSIGYLKVRESRKLRTPRLSRHFKEVVVPWDVLKVKNKLKHG